MESDRPPVKADPATPAREPGADAPPPGRAARTLWQDDDLVAAQRGVEWLSGQLAEAQARNRTLEARLQAVAASTSWRITRPLRGLMLLLRGQLPLRRLAARMRPGAAPPAEPIRPAPRPVRFPRPGTLAALPPLATETPQPLDVTVSVVVPTYNAGPEFHWLLRKLQGQQGLAGIEIVVVDSGSTDGTAELAERSGCKVVRIPNSDFSHSYARNLGADNAGGQLLLFTVQDAYPIGDWWLHTLALALTRPASEEVRLAAVSCAEFPRRDSEIFYNAAAENHYRFLGCHDVDRVGAFRGEDQVELRTQGQLSDVACLIGAETFQAYRYEGRYAEDLVLGIRLIRDGLRTGMLSSVRVIHSHNRPPAYHLKRSFVDLIFLLEVFPDFPLPPPPAIGAVVTAARAFDGLLRDWRPAAGAPAGAAVRSLAEAARRGPVRVLSKAAAPDLGFAPLGPWLTHWLEQVDPDYDLADLEPVREMFVGRLRHMATYVDGVYDVLDDHLAVDLTAAAHKTLAATIGAMLAVFYLAEAGSASGARRAALDELRRIMLAGI
ncbi:hypothetical protein DJ021_05630 [Phenylobacterium hankyongense]|uniref:Glycosyltransferase 2-like domain-containing protein n=1 Tax=Phenylobacterium hankyongense TaxID=1813876 RepID=A0A328AYQ5_9CAUL|nr:glycosyltransferase family 2 protein [Phenylobacterium hankyongense]RAK59321.1 hypothetical protein DJ021_05630 [Phenylobacterium hankyongense]